MALQAPAPDVGSFKCPALFPTLGIREGSHESCITIIVECCGGIRVKEQEVVRTRVSDENIEKRSQQSPRGEHLKYAEARFGDVFSLG